MPVFPVSFIEIAQAVHEIYRGKKMCPDGRTDKNTADGRTA